MEFIHKMINKEFVADKRDQLTLEIKHEIGLDEEISQLLATKIYKLRKINQFDAYPEPLPDSPDKIINHPYFNELLDMNGHYLRDDALEFLLPDEPDQDDPPLKDQKHKIYRIRKRAKEQYYGPYISNYINEATTKQIYNLMFYPFINTSGYCRKSKRNNSTK